MVSRYNCADQVLRDMGIVGQQLLRIFGQAISAIAEGRIIVKIANARIKAYALDDIRCIQSSYLSIAVQFVKLGYPQRQVCIGK